MKTIEERFWAKVNKTDTCWEWTGSKVKAGYGQLGVKIDDKWTIQKAHRISYELANGPIPEHDSYHGLCVCHTCNNPKCVNPNHLFLGTQQDNLKDRDAKGRQNSKLTEAQVLEIRKLYQTNDYSQRELGEMFQVSQTQISHIINSKRWAHLQS